MEAARQHVPMTELCRRWMSPQINQLKMEDDKKGDR